MEKKNSVEDWALVLLAEQYQQAAKSFHTISVLPEPQADPSFLAAWKRWQALEREWSRRGFPPQPLEHFLPFEGKRSQRSAYARFKDKVGGEFIFYADYYRETHNATWPVEVEGE